MIKVVENIKVGSDYIETVVGAKFLNFVARHGKPFSLGFCDSIGDLDGVEIECNDGNAQIKLGSRKEVIKELRRERRIKKERRSK